MCSVLQPGFTQTRPITGRHKRSGKQQRVKGIREAVDKARTALRVAPRPGSAWIAPLLGVAARVACTRTQAASNP